jgi:tagatose 1,6-diphosphate aldolase
VTRTLTPGKWRGLKTTSNSDVFSVLAFDQRGNYMRMLPEGTDLHQAAQIKLEVCSALSSHVTAVLLDPNYGLPAALEIRGSCGLLMALEKTGYSGDPLARQIDFMDGWTVEKIKGMGASAVKLLVYYNPDAEAAATEIERVIQQVAQDCEQYDIPLFVEPLVYSIDTAVPADSAEFAAQRPRLVTETARRLSSLSIDVLKLEFPIDVKYDGDTVHWLEACQAVSEVSTVPWVLLSAGVDFEVFLRQVEIACKGGASGFLGGRAIWKEVVTMSPEARAEFLSTSGASRVTALREVTEQFARPWTSYYVPVQFEENWFVQYHG